MSSARISEAFELTNISPATKLAAIYIGDNWNEEDEFAEVNAQRLADFCCIQPFSVRLILNEMVYCGFFSEVNEMPGGIWRVRFRCWRAVVSSRQPRPEISKEVRARISERDKTCVYCGDDQGPFHIDHIVPRTRAGSDDESNLALACAPCNIAKRDRLPEEWKGPKDRPFTLDRVNNIRGLT